jgi:ribosomal protein S27AE
MHMKLNKRCPTCGAYLEFAEQKDGVYMQCRRCRLSVYVPMEVAAEHAADFPLLIELMTLNLAEIAKRTIKKRRIRRRFG